MRFEKKAMLGFRLAHELLDMPLDKSILKNLVSSRIVSVLALDTRQRLFSTSEPEDRGFFRLWSHYLSMDSSRDRFRFLVYVYRTLRIPKQWRTTLLNLYRFFRTVTVHSLYSMVITKQDIHNAQQRSVNESREML
jgi:hypothetical protein